MDFGKNMRAGTALAEYSNLLPPDVLPRAKDYFAYVVSVRPLAASGTATRSFSIDADSDFLLTSINGLVVAAADDVTVSAAQPVTLDIRDSGSGRLLQNAPVHHFTLAGSGVLPGYLPYPKLVPRGSVVTINYQNLVATAWNVYNTFAGFKVFTFPDR